MGAFLLIPFFLIRYGVMALMNRNALRRAAHFAPLEGREVVAYWAYQISTVSIFVTLFFLKIQLPPLALFISGAILYAIGTAALTASVVSFATPAQDGMNRDGIYRLSRNPIYVAYFLFFVGCALLTQSLMLFGYVLAFQISTHWIILAEERWCIQRFGPVYRKYMDSVRRYL